MTIDPHVANLVGGSIFVISLAALLLTGHYYGFGVVLLLGLLLSVGNYYRNGYNYYKNLNQ